MPRRQRGFRVPMLQMRGHNAGAGIASHDRTACHMGGLVDTTVVGSLAGCCRRRDVGACRFGDLVDLLRKIDRHLALVLANVERHAQKRLSIGIDIGRIEIDIILPMRIPAAMGGYAEIMCVPIGVGLLPRRAPFRRSGRHGTARDRPSVGHIGVDVSAPEEAKTAVVEIVAVELVDHGL